MKHGVYQIRNIQSGKIYVGSSAGRDGLPRRWIDHRKALRGNYHKNPYLQNAWNKYGEDWFVFEILLYCDPENCLWYEQMTMDHYQPEYNISPTAGSNLGFKMTTKTKQLMSKNRKGVPKTDEARRNIAKAKLGNKNPMYGVSLRGSRNGASKLTELSVCDIKDMIVSGFNNHEIARRFGVTPSNISCIRRGVTWNHV